MENKRASKLSDSYVKRLLKKEKFYKDLGLFDSNDIPVEIIQDKREVLEAKRILRKFRRFVKDQ